MLVIGLAILPKAIHRFNAVLIKIPISFFTELEKSILKFIRNHKIPWIEVILNKKSNTGGITILDFELYYRGIVTKTDTQPNGIK
jgi:hypothetical protein